MNKIASWNCRLAEYRKPNNWRSLVELTVTILPFVMLWTAMSIVSEVNYLACLIIAYSCGRIPCSVVYDPARLWAWIYVFAPCRE